MLLLNPGPVSLSERVRRSLLKPDLCHRESEFFDLQDEIRKRLLAVYDLDPSVWCAVLMSASGTAAVESMLAALVPEAGRVLIAENGVYGERMAQICTQYRIAHQRVGADWLQPLKLDAIDAQLNSRTDGGRFSHVAVVHHETTTGRLNGLEALSEVSRASGVGLLVDAVSSFGAEHIDFADPSLAAVAATANKCLHGVPGVAFVIVRRAALAAGSRRAFYLDLARLAQLQDQRNTPFTPAVQIFYGLLEALREFADEGGRKARHQRYAALAEQVRAGLATLGIEAMLPAAHSSVVLRSYRLPADLSYQVLHDALKSKGFVIYAGQGGLSDKLFRISTMGAVTGSDIDRLLDCFRQLVR